MVVGRLGRPHGLRGHVKVYATGPTLGALAPPISILLRGAQVQRATRVLELAGAGQQLVVLTSEATDREGAAALTGQELLLPRGELPALEGPDEYYVADLIGIDVEVEGERVGRLVDVLERPANDVLEIEAPDGRSVLVPFVAEAVRTVDHEQRMIVLEAWTFGEQE